MKVCVNAGHCPGLDCGAVGQYSEEADICRSVAEQLCYNLDGEGHTAIFVQEDEISDICEVANINEVDVFISIHCNAANGVAHGTETFYWEYGDDSYKLAELVQYELLKTLGTTDRGLKDGQNFDGCGHALGVLRGTDMECTILTELAFIDNPLEEDLLSENIDEMAQALCNAICLYGKEKGIA